MDNSEAQVTLDTRWQPENTKIDNNYIFEDNGSIVNSELFIFVSDLSCILLDSSVMKMMTHMIQ
jgi:hypothetical protein